MRIMSFLDLGFGQGIVKFVSQYEAKGDFERINKIIGLSFLIYIWMGLLSCFLLFFLSSFLASDLFSDLFKVPKGQVQTATLASKIVAFGFLVNFVNGIFSNIPRALQRYDISVKIQTAVWFCRSLFVFAFGKTLHTIKMRLELLIRNFKQFGLYFTAGKVLRKLRQYTRI